MGLRAGAVRSVVAIGVLAAGVGCSTAAAPTGAPPPTGGHDRHPPTGAATATAAPAAPAGGTERLRVGERFSTLRVARPYAPAAPNGGTDEYRCFLVDPGLRRPAVLTGSTFLPGDPGLVHHAIFYRVPPADVPAARALDRRDDGDGWTCFGGTGLGGRGAGSQLGTSEWVAAWAPGGSAEVPTPPGTGHPLPAGSQLVMQVHYNLLGAPAGATDRPGIRLRLADPAAGLVPLRTELLPAPVELPCAAGESGPLCDRATATLDVMRRFGPQAGSIVAGLTLLCSPDGTPHPGGTQSCRHRVRDDGTVYAVAGHMHLRGTRITVELNPDRPGARTLLDVDPYDFHDQRSVTLPRPVRVAAGDTLRVTCRHDTSGRGRPAGLPPRYVVWGDGTTDEMCLGIVVRD